MTVLAPLLVAAAAILAATVGKAVLLGRIPPEITPLKGQHLTELAQFNETYRKLMLWGTYRPGLYLGLKSRTSPALNFGIMWFDPDQVTTLTDRRIRHEASQNDGLSTYGWIRHDGQNYGRQAILDEDYNISASWVKSVSPRSPGGGDWALHLTAGLRAGTTAGERRLSFVVYVYHEGDATSSMNIIPTKNKKGTSVLAEGIHSVLGPWSLHMTTKNRTRQNHMGVRVEDPEQLVKVKDMVLASIWQTAQSAYQRDQNGPLQMYLPDQVSPGANLAVFQVTANLPLALDITLLAHEEEYDAESEDKRLQQLTGKGLLGLLAEGEDRFERSFSKMVQGSGTDAGLDPDHAEVAKAALSNLLGSMGYLYGSSRVGLPTGKVVDYGPSPLYTCTPSRSFFPWGFLWDEGYHQLMVQRWNGKMSREVISHWLDLMNKQGWIPREQILGWEARQRVPQEFVVQHPTHANPPSLFFPLMFLAQQLKDTSSGECPSTSEQEGDEGPETLQFLQAAWPRLEAWYGWFNRTQRGPLPGTYRWHGRNGSTDRELNPRTLMSGLDDYPRASHPSDNERHLDLRCWMLLASQVMAKVGRAVGASRREVEKYEETAAHLSDLNVLNALHYDADTGMYLDYGLHTEEVRLETETVMDADGTVQQLTRRVTGTPPIEQFIPSYGYVSLFPLLMWVLPPDSPELGRQLELLQDPNLLWTDYGLRSLASTSSLYKQYNTAHDPPYWRGRIWININYLALRALHHYSHREGPHKQMAQDLYRQLRQNVLGNVVQQYYRTGYIWEQYDDMDGSGKGSHPFTGWSALVSLMATETY